MTVFNLLLILALTFLQLLLDLFKPPLLVVLLFLEVLNVADLLLQIFIQLFLELCLGLGLVGDCAG